MCTHYAILTTTTGTFAALSGELAERLSAFDSAHRYGVAWGESHKNALTDVCSPHSLFDTMIDWTTIFGAVETKNTELVIFSSDQMKAAWDKTVSDYKVLLPDENLLSDASLLLDEEKHNDILDNINKSKIPLAVNGPIAQKDAMNSVMSKDRKDEINAIVRPGKCLLAPTTP